MKKVTKHGYKMIQMDRGLDYPVYNGKIEVIPAGAKKVCIGFGQSHLVENLDSGKFYKKNYNVSLKANERRLNVYYYNGKIIHA